MKDKVLIGPLPPLIIEQLTVPLKEHGMQYEVMNDAARSDDYQRRRHLYGPDPYPTYQGEDTVLLELSLEAVMLIRSDLEKLGVVLKESDFDPDFDGKDYLCPKCGHGAKAPGTCPRHHVALLEFSEFAAFRRRRSESRAKAFAIVMFIIGGCAVMFALYLQLLNWFK